MPMRKVFGKFDNRNYAINKALRTSKCDVGSWRKVKDDYFIGSNKGEP